MLVDLSEEGGASGKIENGVKLKVWKSLTSFSGLVPSQVVFITEVSDVYVKDEEN